MNTRALNAAAGEHFADAQEISPPCHRQSGAPSGIAVPISRLGQNM
jgi:hypothetical protein